MRAEQLTGAEAGHGEGPVWWPAWGGLCWVDMLRGDVLRLTPTGVDRWSVGTIAAAMRPRLRGGVVVATEHSFEIADEFGGALTPVATVVHDSGVRFNEGGCDPHGRFLCGTMRYDAAPGGGDVYRLNPDSSVETVLTGVTISNGLAWGVPGGPAYYVDSADQRIDVLEVDDASGALTRRPWVEIQPDDGAPDGLAVDAEGGVWVALWGAGQVRRYDRDGTLSDLVELPVPKVTACTFGGELLDELFITTSRHEESDPGPGAGAVFVVRPGVRGLPTLGYAG